MALVKKTAWTCRPAIPREYFRLELCVRAVSAIQTLRSLPEGYGPNALRCTRLSLRALSRIEALRATIA